MSVLSAESRRDFEIHSYPVLIYAAVCVLFAGVMLENAGVPVPGDYRERMLREYWRWELVNRQVQDLEAEQKQRVRTSTAPAMTSVSTRPSCMSVASVAIDCVCPAGSASTGGSISTVVPTLPRRSFIACASACT